MTKTLLRKRWLFPYELKMVLMEQEKGFPFLKPERYVAMKEGLSRIELTAW